MRSSVVKHFQRTKTYLSKNAVKKSAFLFGILFLIAFLVAGLTGAFAAPSDSPLQLLWLGSDDVSHLQLDPPSAEQQTIALRLDFLSGSDRVYAPGEIEIRIPRWILPLRNGDNPDASALVYSHQLPATVEADIHNNGFLYHGVQDGYIILRNHRSFSGSERFSADISFAYRPHLVEDNFSANIVGTVSTAGDIHSSNALSLNFNNRIVLNHVNKEVVNSFPVWQNNWGARPSNHEDHFFVAYGISINVSRATTQPFTMSLVERPGYYNGVAEGVSGEVVAWTVPTPITPNMNGSWTRGDITAFNSSVNANWDMSEVVRATFGLGSNWLNNRNFLVIVQYPRNFVTDPDTGNRIPEPDQRVTNSIDITLSGVDGKTVVENASASTIFNTIDFEYDGDLFGLTKTTSASSLEHLAVALTHLQNERPVELLSWIEVTARGFSLTDNGQNPFTTQVIDDYVYLEVSEGLHVHQLNPGDYRFTGVWIQSLIEYEVVLDSSSNELSTRRVANDQRGDLEVYGRFDEFQPWEHVGTITNPNLPFFFEEHAPNRHFSNVKVVHNDGKYSVNMRIRLDLELLPTANVRNLIYYSPFGARFHNFANLQIFRYGDERLPENLVNVVDASNYVGTLASLIRARDIRTYGRYVQRATSNTFLGRAQFAVLNDKTTLGILRDHTTGAEVIHYELIAVQGVHPATFTESDLLLLQDVGFDIREGVFFDLLPRGAILNIDSIVAFDARRILPAENIHVTIHENWRGSGQDLLEVRLEATDGFNGGQFFGGRPIGEGGQPAIGANGTGFQLRFSVNYPWSSINDYGRNVRNIAAFQSRSGRMDDGLARPDNGQWNNFTPIERELMANLARDASGVTLPSGERNTVYMTANTNVNFLGATNIGFTKQVRGPLDNQYTFESFVEPNEAYRYRLRFQNSADNYVSNLIMFDVLEAAHNGRAHWRGTLQSVDVSQPRMHGADPVIYYSTLTGIDPVNNVAHANLSSSIWTTTKPADASTITAVAVDLRTGTDGNPWRIEPLQTTIVNLHMRAPSQGFSSAAYNRAAYIADLNPTAGGPTVPRQVVQTPYTEVWMPIPVVYIQKRDASTNNNLAGARLRLVEVSTGTVIRTWTSTTTSERFENLALGEYRIEEVEAPSGFHTPDTPQTFTLNSSRNLTQTITVYNSQNQLTIRKIDADSSNQAQLTGAVMRIEDAQGNIVIPAFTTTNTPSEFNGIAAGVYYLVEITPPSGFTLSNRRQQFTINPGQSNIIVTFENSRNGLNITKVNDETNAPVAGAELRLVNASNQVIREWRSTTEAENFSRLPVGIYYLEELEAPIGFIHDTTRTRIEITETTATLNIEKRNTPIDVRIDKISSQTGESLDGVLFELLDESQENVLHQWVTTGRAYRLPNMREGVYYVREVEARRGYVLDDTLRRIEITAETYQQLIEIDNDRIMIELGKVDASTGDYLAGSTLRLTSVDDELFEPVEWVSTNQARRFGIDEKIPVGIYYLEELAAPEGFIIANSRMRFEVRNTGGVQNIALASDYINVRVSGRRLYIDTDQIPGFVFDLNRRDGTNVKSIMTTDEEFRSSELALGDYVLRNIESPEGRIRNNTPLFFSITEYDEEFRVRIANEFTRVDVRKIDSSTNQILPGAHLRIEDLDGNVIEEWISESDGLLLERIPIGRYRLIETRSPAGFVHNTEILYFDVLETGDIQVIHKYNEPLVDVPDTLMNARNILMVFGGVIIVIGAIILLKTSKNGKNKDNLEVLEII